MWKMFEGDFFDCGDDACDGPGPPPKFHLPPPPRPPFMQDLNAVLGTTIECSEDAIFDMDVCAAFPNFDANFRNSSTLQTSAIIVVCSIFVLLVILFSSLFFWKHKRKMQNFWPCKSLPKRSGQLDTSAISGAGHSVAYEDPDAHLHHHPLVLRHQMLHPKAVHYPSGYPISRSPPVFVCSSPGPDPYRSLDNVYEELGPRDNSDIESEPRAQSDDDFAEDELSLNGAATQPYHIATVVGQDIANTSIPMQTSTLTCAAISQTIPSISSIYNECLNGTITNGENNNGADNGGQSNGIVTEMERSSNDRNSLLSSSSSSTSTAPVNDCIAGNCSGSNGPTRIASPDSGLAIRNRNKRMRNANGKMQSSPTDRINEDGHNDDTSSESNHLVNQHHYYNRNNNNNHNNNNNNHLELSRSISNHLNAVNNNVNINNNNNNNNNNRNGAMLNGNGNHQINGTNGCDIERINQINKKLSTAPSEHPLLPKFGGNRMVATAPISYQNQMALAGHCGVNEPSQMISTIFPGRLITNNTTNLNNYNRVQLQNQYYAPNDTVRSSQRSRTNPRQSRQRNSGNTMPYPYQNDNTYSYAEPIFRENYMDACAPPMLDGFRTISTSNRRQCSKNHHSPPYMLPNYGRELHSHSHSRGSNNPGIASTSVAMNDIGRLQPIYSHDSSFGSDSGYSQYTHNSRTKSDGSNSAHSGSSNGNSGTLSNMFSWARRKDQSSQQQQQQQQQSIRSKSIGKSLNSLRSS